MELEVVGGGRACRVADYTDGVVRMGVLNDQSGLYSDITGQGSVYVRQDGRKLRATIPTEQAFRPLTESGYPLIKK